MTLRVIGDVHGKQDEYLAIAEGAERSLQLGDMGFDYSRLKHASPERFMFIPGNHENFHNLPPNALVEDKQYFGQVPLLTNSFHFGGAKSIDGDWRVPGFDWYVEEEMSDRDMEIGIDLYLELEPMLMFSHDCPYQLTHSVLGYETYLPSATSQALGRMFEQHQPELWVFGHHHQQIDTTWGDTRFICLPELSYVDLNVSGDTWEIIYPS